MNELRIIPLPSVAMVKDGDDLVAMFLEALSASGLTLEPRDLIIVTSKVVSKSEGQVVPFDGTEEHKASPREFFADAGRFASPRPITDSSTRMRGSISRIPTTARPCCCPRTPTARRGDSVGRSNDAATSRSR